MHRLRSALAVLGIFIGVTAVIWLVAMGEGVSYQAQQQIKDLGATNIIVRSIKPPVESGPTRGRVGVLTYGLQRIDYERIRATIPSVRQVVPAREIRKAVRHETRQTDVRLVGCTPDYQKMANLRVARGRFLEPSDLSGVKNVAVIASQTAETLFRYENPIGKEIRIDNDFYVVVGQTADRAPSGNVGGSFAGQDYNLDVYIPLDTLRARIGDIVISSRSGSFEAENVQLSQITVGVDRLEEVDETADIIRTLLERNHTIQDYAITVPKELLEQAEVLQMMFNVLLVLIAGIALLVGGIGIMNIMLATVTERTREIGIRRALGAKQRDIVEQFLSETIVLSATGGLLGVAFGFLCGPAVRALRGAATRLLPDVVAALPANIRELEPRIALWSVAAAFLISVAVGVVFGLYPARRAALMDPIEALRHE